MNDNGGGFTVLVIVIAVGLWFWQGDPARDIRRLFGQQTYEDQSAALEKFARQNRIGSGQDVWLTKLNAFNEIEKVALFFGYWDDWDACDEFKTFYVQRYPSDVYRCEYVR